MINLTTKIVAAYLGNNSIATADIPDLIRTTYSALIGTASPASAPAEPLQPAVSVKKSVSADGINCLECGKKQKMLKRHLSTAHGLSVTDYRAKWSLPSDYPMVAPDYAARRSELAVAIGLGRKKGVDASAAKDVPAGSLSHSYPASRWSKPSA